MSGWTSPLKPVDQDNFGVVFKVALTENAQQINYIFHRGDEKDPGPDQFLVLDDSGYEVWQLQGADPENPYVRPVPQASGGSTGNILEQSAYWVLEDTIAWADADSAANSYQLCYAPEGGLEATASGITGGDCITLTRDPAGLPQAVQEKMPHIADLPALKISADDLDMVPDILKGQVAVSAVDGAGVAQGATGLQIQGVLDDLYTYDGRVGRCLGRRHAGDPAVGADGQERHLPPLRRLRSGHDQHDLRHGLHPGQRRVDHHRPAGLGVAVLPVRGRGVGQLDPGVSSTTWSPTRTASAWPWTARAARSSTWTTRR